jgi:hypothetical protein
MTDYTERGAVPVDDAATPVPPTIDEVLARRRAQRDQDSRTTDEDTDAEDTTDEDPSDGDPSGERTGDGTDPDGPG